MCGIAGLLDGRSSLSEETLGATARSMADSLRHRGKEQGIFDPGPIRGLWAEHLAGRGYGEHKLWDILMFHAWHDRWMCPSISEGG